MKKTIALLLALVLTLGLLASCAKKPDGGETTATSAGTIQIAIPNDTTNEARALILLENLGIIKLKGGRRRHRHHPRHRRESLQRGFQRGGSRAAAGRAAGR